MVSAPLLPVEVAQAPRRPGRRVRSSRRTGGTRQGRAAGDGTWCSVGSSSRITQMRLPSSWASESMALTAISSQVEIRPRRLACWSPREVRNRNPVRSSSDIHSRMEKGSPVSGRSSSAERLAVSMARTESAVFGFSGSTIDCATVPSIASASAVRSVFRRWSTRTRLLRRLALLPEHARAVREELPSRRHPERIDRVLLLRDQRGRHHVEVAGVARFQEGRPARRAGVERVQQHVAVLVEERTRV